LIIPNHLKRQDLSLKRNITAPILKYETNDFDLDEFLNSGDHAENENRQIKITLQQKGSEVSTKEGSQQLSKKPRMKGGSYKKRKTKKKTKSIKKKRKQQKKQKSKKRK
jgi:hypothetical protein